MALVHVSTTMFHLQNFKICFNMLKIKNKKADSVNPDEVTHHGLPYLDLFCLQVQLVLVLVL